MKKYVIIGFGESWTRDNLKQVKKLLLDLSYEYDVPLASLDNDVSILVDEGLEVVNFYPNYDDDIED